MSTELISTAIVPGRPRQYGRRQRRPPRRYAGIAAVLLLHALFIWALMSGLATKVTQVIQKPIETTIIEPVKPPAPPPPTVKLPSPKRVSPPRFVPPPEVRIATPPAPTIAHQATPVPTPEAPSPPVAAPVAPLAQAKPISRQVGVVCPNSDDVRRSVVYPREAQDNDITGDVTISFVVDLQGHVTDEKIEQSADPILDRTAFNAVKKFNCIAQGEPVRVQVPFSFNLN